MKRSRFKPSEIAHLRRLIGWVRCEIGPSPDESVRIVRSVVGKFGPIDDCAKRRLIEHHQRIASVPKYVRAAIKALEKLVHEVEGEIVDGEFRSNRMLTADRKMIES